MNQTERYPNWQERIEAHRYDGLKIWQAKDVWTRLQEGDRSPQIVAEVAALYARVCAVRSERYTTLKNQHVDQIWERFRELELHREHKVQWWAGKAVKAPMVAAIVDVEYPTQRYVETLQMLDVDPESIYSRSGQFIEKATEWQKR